MQGTRIANYIDKISNTVGMGLQTTCGYNFVGTIPANSTLSAYFSQMDFCIPLRHNMGQQFLGHTFAHCTSLPVIIQSTRDGTQYKIRNQKEEEDFIIAAWGGTGGRTEGARRQGFPEFIGQVLI